MMIRFSYLKFLSISLITFLMAFAIVPNLFNSAEQKAFSEDVRLNLAQKNYGAKQLGDSARVVPGSYYKLNYFKKLVLGVSYRDVWQQEIRVSVLNLKENNFTPVAFTGGLQTIGIKVKDDAGLLWSVRSVNKDQAVALPRYLHFTVLRPMFRDRACSMDPFGGLAVAKFSQALKLHSLDPKLYLFPYDGRLGKYNTRMAGRLVTLQRRWDVGEQYLNNERLTIVNTEKALALFSNKKASIDTSLYLRSRLFDMLISDWDRHNGNWRWLLKKSSGKYILVPIAVDRDMAFYNFGEGIVNHIALLVDSRFQSFTPEFANIKGLMKQSKHLDIAFLKGVEKHYFMREVETIQKSLSVKAIHDGFKTYPESAYKLIGKSHQSILKKRLEQLPKVAGEFYELINSAG